MVMVVVRHGRTAHNAAGRFLGRLDVPLDPTGEGQAARLGRAIQARFGVPDVVVTSPLQRTRSTAEALAGGTPIVVDDRIVELDYGEWDGLPLAELDAADWAAWRADPFLAPPGGESLAELGQRVRTAAEDWAARAVDELVVLVTHVSPIKALVAWSLGVGDEVTWRMFVAPASVTVLDTSGPAPRLMAFNDTSHLHEPG